MGDGVEEAEDANEPSDEFVEVDVAVKRQEPIHPLLPEPSDGSAEDHEHDEGTVKVQNLTYIVWVFSQTQTGMTDEI